MSTRHTPGPWVIEGKRPTKLHVHVSAADSAHWQAFAEVVVRMNHETTDSPEGLANAHLIATAPDLLALAKQYASECSECNGTGLRTISYGGDGFGNRCAARADADDQPCPDCEDIRKVIDKAEGRAG